MVDQEDMFIAGGGRIYNVLERAYRVRVYRPARYYLTWYFLASIIATLGSVVIPYQGWQIGETNGTGGVNGILASTPAFLIVFFSGLFLLILSTFNGLIASSPHLVEGDRGIYSLGSIPATAPIVTKTTFIVNTPEKRALYEPKYEDARITRYLVWRWGRKGGNLYWPGKAGGKSEGFFAAVTYSWEEAEYLDGETLKREVIERQPCPTCNQGRHGADLGFTKVPGLSSGDLAAMAEQWPGVKRGGVIDLRLQVMADRYLEELPDAIADAIQHDEEFRATSRVDVMFDPLPEGRSLGSVLDHNAQAELFGLEYTTKKLRKEIVLLHQDLNVVSQLAGGRSVGNPGIGTGQPPR